eukprot:2442032-Pyramimonas_sp.AAC.1
MQRCRGPGYQATTKQESASSRGRKRRMGEGLDPRLLLSRACQRPGLSSMISELYSGCRTQ